MKNKNKKNERAKFYALFFTTVVALIFTSGCNMSVNKDIAIDNGKRVGNSQNSVNGNITIGSNCDIGGSCRSVNGNILVQRESQVRELQTVNGRIGVGQAVVVRGDVESVNGSVVCDSGAEVTGSVSTINGSIDLNNTLVRRDVSTYNGHVTLLDQSMVHGDIIVKKSKGNSNQFRPLEIRIAEGSVVEGDILVRDDRIDVIVILAEGGTVKGEVIDAEVVRETD
ncbi:hypothetical protein JW824_11295 [bacterium]|nr:hypothetical protein [bacterium]RQV92214.1 MAG: hypothetical protein EH221_11915 [bacterium]